MKHMAEFQQTHLTRFLSTTPTSYTIVIYDDSSLPGTGLLSVFFFFFNLKLKCSLFTKLCTAN